MSGAGRRWLELSARRPVAEDLAPLVVEALLSLGGRAAEEREGWLLTHLPAPDELDAFLAEARRAIEAATGIDGIEVRGVWREHEDWSETWKRGLGPRRITDRILVHPSWLPAPGDTPPATIVLDPGMAFGTAEHGTTRGCLRLLDRAVRPGDTAVDVGAGSGVLAIAAVLLGAASCTAIEADPLSCEALRENVERNHVADRVRCVEARVDAKELARLAPVAGVVANIETGVLRPLLGGFARALAPGGWLILSGILEAEWPALRADAEAAHFRFVDLDADGEWRSGLFALPG
ncbi:MAG TPA: 50S ribosomal protein L11 methyltransferase [Longimicrobiales bacterium]|nr:50S ribosomal protein L11 methyltransferase [Longimicrobiales bacterium]